MRLKHCLVRPYAWAFDYLPDFWSDGAPLPAESYMVERVFDPHDIREDYYVGAAFRWGTARMRQRAARTCRRYALELLR